MQNDKITRRSFIQGTAATAGVLLLPGQVLGKGAQSANNKLNVACIGAGGRGKAAVEGMLKENIVALCDVDDERAADSFKLVPDAKKYRDYRKMLAEMGDKIDAVTISTPDHMHFPAAMMAICMGKHVFVEKPMAHTVWECRQMRLAAKKHGVATQMGNQGHAMEGTRLIREWIEADLIGTVREVHYWTNRPIWPQAIKRPTEPRPEPACRCRPRRRARRTRRP